jgi:hypothetical protein
MASTIPSRLLAHGADMERVYIVNGVPDGKGGTRLLELPDDLTLLESKILQREATLMIVDPIMTLLSGDMYKDRESRRALTPVRDMAERTACAIVGVRNLNKSVGLRAIQRGGGNMGLIGVARAGAFFAEHPDDDALRVMAQHKSNLAATPPSLSYRVVSSEVHKTARVQWEGRTEHNADSLASGPASPAERSKLDEAREFLRDELSDGPCGRRRSCRTPETRLSPRQRCTRRRPPCGCAPRRSASRAGSGRCPPRKTMISPRRRTSRMFAIFQIFKARAANAGPIPLPYRKMMKVMKFLKATKVGVRTIV